MSLNTECIEYCNAKLEDCQLECHGEVDCNFECKNTALSCVNSCPCFEECPIGCDGCYTPFCMCYDYENNPDYIDCTKYNENLYTQCIVGCPAGDFECLSMCFRDLEENLEFCPCRSRCPDGCPCPEYDCPPTTTVELTSTTTVSDTTQSTETKPK